MDPLNPTFLVGHHYIKRQPEQMQPVTGNGRKVELKRLGKSLMVDIESQSGGPGIIRGDCICNSIEMFNMGVQEDQQKDLTTSEAGLKYRQFPAKSPAV